MDPPPGWVVNASVEAGPTVMLMALLVAAVKVPSVALIVYPVPARLMEQPAKVATPAVALSGFDVHDDAAPLVPVPEVMASVMAEVLEVTTSPQSPPPSQPAEW